MISKNLNPMGRLNNFMFGVAELFDGLIRVLSLGYLRTEAPLTQSRNATTRHFKKLRELREKTEKR